MIVFWLLIKYLFILALLFTPLIGFWAKGRLGLQWWQIFMLTSLVAYLLIVLGALAAGWYADAVLQSYDLDGNGMFSGDELTPEQDKAMQQVVRDAGRTFAPIVGLVFAPLGVLLGFVGCSIMVGLWQRIINNQVDQSPNKKTTP